MNTLLSGDTITALKEYEKIVCEKKINKKNLKIKEKC